MVRKGVLCVWRISRSLHVKDIFENPLWPIVCWDWWLVALAGTFFLLYSLSSPLSHIGLVFFMHIYKKKCQASVGCRSIPVIFYLRDLLFACSRHDYSWNTALLALNRKQSMINNFELIYNSLMFWKCKKSQDLSSLDVLFDMTKIASHLANFCNKGNCVCW